MGTEVSGDALAADTTRLRLMTSDVVVSCVSGSLVYALFEARDELR
jgi:hypothetical protein